MRLIGYGLLIVFLASGCAGRMRHIPGESFRAEDRVEVQEDRNGTSASSIGTGTLYNTNQKESRYALKPEPYSVGSNQKDPELLGPQRTIEKPKLEQTQSKTIVDPITNNVTTVEPVSKTGVTSASSLSSNGTSSETMAIPKKSIVEPEASTKPIKTSTISMTKSECISMIGNEKFERYSKRFGGEAGAIKRCAILKKLKRG